ncbi:hypothetical protein [Streptosporangium sp. NPDC023615]|uniref:hypothetical protein n=1 Tax=Streptosporangium sp. NPDC023615 TaxID=3154794 RepID=UPI00342CAA76
MGVVVINVEASRLREPAAWLMVAVASASVLVGIERLLFGGSGFGSPSFPTRAAIQLGTFTSPVTVALLVGAVLLATHLGPVIARLRPLVLTVTITLGLSVLFGLISLLAGALGGAPSARDAIELLLVHLPALALAAVALLYVLPRVIPATSAAGGPRGEGAPGHLRGEREWHQGHDRPSGPGYGPVPMGEQGRFQEQGHFQGQGQGHAQGQGPDPSREHAPFQGAPFQGAPFQGTPEGRDPREGYGHPQGAPFQGAPGQAAHLQGVPGQGVHPQGGAPGQGVHPQGVPGQGGHPQEHFSQQGFHPQDRPAQGMPPAASAQAPSPQIPYGRPALPPAPAHASTGTPVAESTAGGVPSEGYDRHSSAFSGDGPSQPSQAGHPPQAENRPYTEDPTWPGRLRTPEQQASQHPAPETVSPLSAPLQGNDPGPYIAADVQPPSSSTAYDPQDSGRRTDSPSYGWQEASSPGSSGRHSEPQAQNTGWPEPQQPGYGQHHSSPRLPDPLSSESLSSNPRLPDPLTSVPPPPGPLSSEPVYGRTDPQNPGWGTDTPLYEHRVEQGQGGSAAGRPEGPGWQDSSYGRQESSSGWYSGSQAPGPDRSEQWSRDRSEQGHRAESQGFGQQQGPYTPDLQAAAPRGQGDRPEQQAPDGPAGANLAPDDVSASPFEDRPSPFGDPPASPFGDRAPNPFPTPPENYGGPAAAPGADSAYSTAPDLHYPTPDPVDLRSQQMAQAYQQAKNYQQTRGNEPPLRVPEYGTSGYGDPFGHPQTPQASQHPEDQHPRDQHPRDQHAHDPYSQAQPSQDRYSQAQPVQDRYSQAQPSPAPQYPPRDQQRWDAPSEASEATLRFDPAAYRDDPLGAPAPPVSPPASASAPVPERWDSQPIDPTAIYRPEQRRGQVTDEETPDTEKVGPGQDQNISWYGSDRREP